MRYLLLALLCASAHASEIDWNKPPPADWPTLTQKVLYVSAYDFETYCKPDEPNVGGCAIPYFDLNLCMIYVRDDLQFYLALLTHEEGHCDGKDHYGESAMADKWAVWKRRVR